MMTSKTKNHLAELEIEILLDSIIYSQDKDLSLNYIRTTDTIMTLINNHSIPRGLTMCFLEVLNDVLSALSTPDKAGALVRITGYLHKISNLSKTPDLTNLLISTTIEITKNCFSYGVITATKEIIDIGLKFAAKNSNEWKTLRRLLAR